MRAFRLLWRWFNVLLDIGAVILSIVLITLFVFMAALIAYYIKYGCFDSPRDAIWK